MIMKFNEINAHDIISLLSKEKSKVIGDLKTSVDKAAPITKAEERDLTFCTYQGDRAVDLINQSKSKLIICEINTPFEKIQDKSKTLILVSNARLNFVRCLSAFFTPSPKVEIHQSAIIGNNCSIGKDVYIGSNVIIGDKVTIGDQTQIFPGVIIYDDVKIGNNVLIFSNSVIGADGFSHLYNEKGELEKFPQLGSVRIEDNVEIGTFCCINRGTMTETIISEGTRINNMVHVAHNVKIGKHCFIVSQIFIGGGVIIKNHAWIGSFSSLRDNITIGEYSTVGQGANVVENVPDKATVAGNPARQIKSSFKGGRNFEI